MTQSESPHPPSPAALAEMARGQQKPTAAQLSGAEAIERALRLLETDVVFGAAGAAGLPISSSLAASAHLRYLLTRDEQGAGFAATGYAQASGKVGVCVAGSGASATNLVTALAAAHADSVPIVAITSQVSVHLLGTDAVQEVDIRGITLPVTKHSFMVQSAAEIPATLAAAFHLAATGRPGVVLVDIPANVQVESVEFSWPPVVNLPGYRTVETPHPKQIEEAMALLQRAHRPVLYVGGGAVHANAAEQVRDFAELTNIPVVTTRTALGILPTSHGQVLGGSGVWGAGPATTALQQADLVIAVGVRFDDRAINAPGTVGPHAAVIHADIDPAEIGKNRTADVPIVGDAACVLAAMSNLIRSGGATAPDLSDWWLALNAVPSSGTTELDKPSGTTLTAGYVVQELSRATGPHATLCCGAASALWRALQHAQFEHPRAVLCSDGLAASGYPIPAAMGAQVAGVPDGPVWALVDEDDSQSSFLELSSCVEAQFPIKVLLIRRNAREQHDAVGLNYLAIAEAMGCATFAVTAADDVIEVFRQASAVPDRPVVVEVVVEADESEDVALGAPAQEPLAEAAKPEVAGAGGVEKRHTLSVLVQDVDGIISRIAGMFTRRGFPMYSFSSARTEVEGINRITIVAVGDEIAVEQITKQLNKLVDVLKVVRLEEDASITRAMVLVKVNADNSSRPQVVDAANIFRARIVDVAPESVVIEATGTPGKLGALLDVLDPFGIREYLHSGEIALGRGPKTMTLPKAAPQQS